MKKTKVLNLFAGPGAGKSTLAADVFARLKHAGQNVEMVREYAKELVWRYGQIPDHITQEDILKEQYQRQADLKGQVDLIITDSPLVLSTIYGSNVVDAYNLYEEFENLNFLVSRKKGYNPKGRYQTEEEARALDVVCEKFASEAIDGTPEGGEYLANLMLDVLGVGVVSCVDGEDEGLTWGDPLDSDKYTTVVAHYNDVELTLISRKGVDQHLFLLNGISAGQFLESRSVVVKWIEDNYRELINAFKEL